MLSTSNLFFEIPVDILFSVIAYLINFAQKNQQNNRSLNVCFKSQLGNQKYIKKSVLYLMKDYKFQFLQINWNSLFKVSINTWQDQVNRDDWIKHSLLCGLIMRYQDEIETLKNLKNTYRIKCLFVFMRYIKQKIFHGTVKLRIWSSIGIVHKPQSF